MTPYFGGQSAGPSQFGHSIVVTMTMTNENCTCYAGVGGGEDLLK